MIPATSLNKDDPPSIPEEAEEAPTTQQDFTSDDPSDYLIRANQGHSIKVDVEGLLTPITIEAGNIPSTCVHGTDSHAWKLILKSGGLRRMGRTHIHFASGLPAGFTSASTTEEKQAQPVISGMRKSSTILIYVDVKKALEKGIKFWVSENGVVLSEGDEKGVLSYEFFERVESRGKEGGVLMTDGVLPEGVEVDVEGWEKEFGDGKGKGKRGGRGGRGGGGGRGGRGGKAKAVDDSGDASTAV